jgi:hypothetical protein
MKHILLLLTTIFAVSCSSKEIIIEKPKLVEKSKLTIQELVPIRQYDFQWIVLTKDNFSEIMKDIETKDQSIVLFAVTPQGYQNLSLSVAELRKFILQQQAIIMAYKKYYENEQ